MSLIRLFSVYFLSLYTILSNYFLAAENKSQQSAGSFTPFASNAFRLSMQVPHTPQGFSFPS